MGNIKKFHADKIQVRGWQGALTCTGSLVLMELSQKQLCQHKQQCNNAMNCVDNDTATGMRHVSASSSMNVVKLSGAEKKPVSFITTVQALPVLQI